MRNLPNLILTASLMFFSLFSVAQEQETITFVSSQQLEGANNIILDLKGDIQTTSWDEDYIRVVLEIKTNGVTKEVVRHLVSKNRFRIVSDLANANTLILLNSNMNLPVYINGHPLQEDISYKVFVPKNTIVYVSQEEKELYSIAAIID